MLHRRLALMLLFFVIATPVAAQKTADQARLSLGLSAGFIGGTDVWSVADQPLYSGTGGTPQVDSLAITRRTRSTVGVVFHGTYFPGDHVGFTGEAMLVGLGFEDDCRLQFASGSLRNAEVCDDINQNTDPGTAVALSAGVIYRVLSRQFVSPYVRVHAGFAVTQSKALQVEGTFRVDSTNRATVVVYNSPKPKRVTPAFGVGVGATFALGRGYQIRAEARDNIIGIQTVTGTTAFDGQQPPNKVKYKHNYSLTIGFDIVLERRRGRRY